MWSILSRCRVVVLWSFSVVFFLQYRAYFELFILTWWVKVIGTRKTGSIGWFSRLSVALWRFSIAGRLCNVCGVVWCCLNPSSSGSFRPVSSLRFIPPRERNKATSERMTFFWNRLEKLLGLHLRWKFLLQILSLSSAGPKRGPVFFCCRDLDFRIDFEEFVIFLHVLKQTAEGFDMSLGELLFPGIVKKECLEETDELLPVKNPEDRQQQCLRHQQCYCTHWASIVRSIQRLHKLMTIWLHTFQCGSTSWTWLVNTRPFKRSCLLEKVPRNNLLPMDIVCLVRNVV